MLRVELYIYSPFGPVWPAAEWHLPFYPFDKRTRSIGMQDLHDVDRTAPDYFNVQRIRFAVGQGWICEETDFVIHRDSWWHFKAMWKGCWDKRYDANRLFYYLKVLKKRNVLKIANKWRLHVLQLNRRGLSHCVSRDRVGVCQVSSFPWTTRIFILFSYASRFIKSHCFSYKGKR